MPRKTLFALTILAALSFARSLAAQGNSGWHISPVQINIKVHELRPLQLLDENAVELHSEKWYVDNPELADIQNTEDGKIALWPKAEGVVRVMAVVGGVTETREVKIWPAEANLFGETSWSVQPLGRALESLPAVPTADGADMFALEQDSKGSYVRALTHNGMQVWLWTLPEATQKVAFVCSDNLGGIIVSAAHGDSYTLYVVGNDGKLRWRHSFAGIRKGHALNYEGLLHVVNQSLDGTVATVSAWDEAKGVEKFSLRIPASYESEKNIQRSGDKLLCVPGRTVANALRTLTSGIFVNTDGDAYTAFTQDEWSVGIDKCAAGSVVDPHQVNFSRHDKLVLWRLHADGTYQNTLIDSNKVDRTPFSAPVQVASPTGDIIPDGFGGVLLSVRWTHTDIPQKISGLPDEFVYRITESGDVAYKFPLPKYSGPLHDEMVLGEQELGFATRGGILVAFNVRDGSEQWRWDSGVPEITISMATSGGGCAVNTPEGVVLVENGVKKRVLVPSFSNNAGAR